MLAPHRQVPSDELDDARRRDNRLHALERRAPLALLHSLLDFRLFRTDLRVDLVSLSQAVPRPRCVRPIARADHFHGRACDRVVPRCATLVALALTPTLV